MTIKELIEQLEKYPEDLEVRTINSRFELMEINKVEESTDYGASFPYIILKE